MKGSHWWLPAAGFIAAMMLILGVVNLFEDDGGPLFGRLIFSAALLVGVALVVAGIRLRATRPGLGSKLVAIGVLPGASGLAFFWFPPAVVFGALAVATSVAAARDRGTVAATRSVAVYALAAVAAVAAAAVAVGLS